MTDFHFLLDITGHLTVAPRRRKTIKGANMDRQIDELSKSLTAGVSPRQALRKFGFGFAGVLLASLGLAGRAAGDPCPKGTHNCRGVCCPDDWVCHNGECSSGGSGSGGCPGGFKRCVGGYCVCAT